MRRSDRERNDGGGRGFRVLDPGGRYLEPLTPPPPPRAPEPYRVAPPSSSLGRAHRRSSFVIIAETRPATPSSRGSSPTLLATGRASPFRGRGFKGPPPHAQSRPQTPENYQHSGRGQRRLDRLASVSQQNSPKRSLIPQPTRRRSVSLTKTNDARSSPKFGRRAAPPPRRNPNPMDTCANVIVNKSRRQSLKVPNLSPIQGTPTKPMDANDRFKSVNTTSNKSTSLKTRNTLTVPNYVGNRRRTSHDRSPMKKNFSPTKRFVDEKKINVENDPPTKIPMRRGSLINKNGSTQSVSSGRKNGQSSKTEKSVEKSARTNNDSNKDSTVKDVGVSGAGGSRENPKDEKNDNNESTNSRFIDVTVTSSEQKKRDDDLGLMDLLKKSSGATGTSSVVNTTTTTAVKPLHIEAAAIMLDNDRSNIGETKTSKNSTPLRSPTVTEVSQGSGISGTMTSDASALPKSPKVTNGRREIGTSDGGTMSSRENDVPATTIKLGSNNANAKNLEKSNAIDEQQTRTGIIHGNKKESNATTISKDKNSNDHGNIVGTMGTSKKSLLSRNGIQNGSRSDMTVSSASSGSRANNSNNNNNNNNNSNNSNNNNNSGNSKETSESEKSVKPGQEETIVSSGKLSVVKTDDVGASVSPGHRKSDSKSSAKSSTTTTTDAGNGDAGVRTMSRNVGAGNTGKIVTTMNSGVRATGNGENGKFRVKQGSETSLKSVNGLSTGSVDSIRSTDTGVSVNTVRGVSSAREKKGMHTMKKSDEIETLSGNIMHLERNGEPAVLDIGEATGDPPESKPTRLDRLKKTITRFHERLPSMRCLGCRRNRKAHSVPDVERRDQSVRQLDIPANGDNGNTGNNRLRRAWTNFKNACRCTRLRECKCCRRAARVAPAESTTPCCPPERRCGAICRRLFSRCACCNRSEAQHTRSIRAKHSLTSVAPPPLSEEQRPKIPEVLVEHNSVMRGAIPCLPVPLAWFCLVWNILIPGSGTVWSGFFNLCSGQPRFAVTASPRARLGAMVVNAVVGVGQLFTVLFCLVGWGWSIWWGVTMIRLARKYKRFRASEAANGDAEVGDDDATGLPPGIPSQALRGMERAR